MLINIILFFKICITAQTFLFDTCSEHVLLITIFILIGAFCTENNDQGPDFDDMSSFFPWEIDDAIQYINLGYGAQAPKNL